MRQPDLSHPGHQRKDSGHVRGGLAGVGGRARYPGWKLVQLTSRRGRLRVRAVVTDRVHNGELYMPMNSAETRSMS